MADAANALNRLPPAGQPAQMQDGEFISSPPRPKLFGQGYRELFGVPKIVVIPNPAAGVDWTYAHSGPSWFLVHTVFGILTTSAVVGTRFVALTVKYTGTTVATFGAVISQAASLAQQYCGSTVTCSAASNVAAGIGIPDVLIVKDSMSIGSLTAGILAADQWSAIALYVEEFTDKCLDYL